MVMEPELVKDVLIRKFNVFRNNQFVGMIDPKTDPLFAQNPFFLKDDEWKDKRAEITPAFTTNRLKALYPLIQDVLLRKIKFVREKKDEALDARELCAKYTIDVVSNCIFGIDAESFTKEKPEIREMGRKLLAPSTSLFVKIFIVTTFPILKHFIKIQFTENHVQQFFVDLMKQALKYREDNNVQREDYLDHVIQLRNKKGINEMAMASHTISFFTDGFDTSSVAIANALYEVRFVCLFMSEWLPHPGLFCAHFLCFLCIS
jgi:cytochrome P450 family 28